MNTRTFFIGSSPAQTCVISRKRFIRHLLLTVFLGLTPFTLRAELVGHWTFDTETNGTTPDSSGNGFDGLLQNGAEVISDPERGNVLQGSGPDFGNGVEFDTLVESHTLGESQGATVAAWVKVSETSGHIYNPIFKLAGAQNELISFGLFNSDSTYIYCFFEGSEPGPNNNDQVTITGSERFNWDEWVHVALTLDRVNDEAITYVNGMPGVPRSISLPGDGELIWTSAVVGDFGGLVDDLRYYDEVLAPAQIEEIMNTSKP